MTFEKPQASTAKEAKKSPEDVIESVTKLIGADEVTKKEESFVPYPGDKIRHPVSESPNNPVHSAPRAPDIDPPQQWGGPVHFSHVDKN
jgi:hypothetical protein